MPEPVEGRSAFFHLVISTSSITVLYLLLLSVPEPVEGTFLFLPVISAPLNQRVAFGAWACRRQILILIPVISTSSITVLLSVPEPVEGTFSLILPVISAPLNQRVAFGAWAESKSHSYSSRWFRLRSIKVLLSVPEPVEGTIYQSLSV